MDVTPQELRSSEIKDSWRGYDRDEVDDLLERAAVTIESLTQKLQDTASRPAPPVAAASALDAYANGYRDRIRGIIESDLENLGRNVEPPSPRPDLHEVELPPERDTAPVAAIERPEPERESAEAAIIDVVEDQSTWDPDPD